MTAHRAIVGLSLLCALAFCAFAVPSAFAATNGTTAVTCVKDANKKGDYVDAHCDTTGTLGASEFKHEVLAANPTKEFVGDNEKTKNETKEREGIVWFVTLQSLNFEIICTIVHSEGTLENKLDAEEHKIVGSGIIVIYEVCTAKNTAQNCKWTSSPGAANGTIVTNTLKSESVEGTPTMTQKFSPNAGKEIGRIEVKECATIPGISYPINGTFSAELAGQMAAGGGNGASAGATLKVVQPDNAGSPLEVGGKKAGLLQIETLTMKEGNPIVSTAP